MYVCKSLLPIRAAAQPCEAELEVAFYRDKPLNRLFAKV